MTKSPKWTVDFLTLIAKGGHVLPDSRMPLYLQIASIIRRMIEQEELPPGARLPSEVAIAEGFSVSRIPVRQALSLLESEGLVSRRRGRGTHVADNIPRTSTIELSGMAFEINRASSRNEMVGIDATPPPPRIARFLEPVSDEIARICRRRIMNDVPFCYIETYVAADAARRIDPSDFETRTMIEILEALGVTFGAVEQTLRAVSPSTGVASMLMISPMDPVMQVEISALSGDGMPVHWSTIHYRGEMFQYRVSRH